MQEAWYKGLKTKAERATRKKELAAFDPAFKALIEVLETKRKPERCRDYSKPNWAHNQIAINEYNQALDDVLALIKDK